ncbi:MAG TPA: hypothetical protein VGO52_21410 [Hyphomonadaceae bacterium]|jgi:uncharacterized repeat protein (TIGR01451 family)|nr:hypothetical protein [Hyphomonadaceae bacterium]
MKHLLLGLSALALAAPAFADVRLFSTVQEEIVIQKPNGGREVKLVAADSVAPGDTVIVRVAYANESDKPASDIVISNPVPEHLSLVDIREGGEPAYSVDGGKTWGALSALKIVSGGETRVAKAADVTNVRWRLTQPLAPGAAGAVAFSARLN